MPYSECRDGAAPTARRRAALVPLLALAAALPVTLPAPAAAQQDTGVVRVRVESQGLPLPGAQVSSGDVRVTTGDDGHAALRLGAGLRSVAVTAFGHSRETVRLSVRPAMDTTIVVRLREHAVEGEAVVVQSTRTGRRIEDEPLRVEVLGREEIEEKMLMTPGDISMMLNETSGVRVQVTSPSLGGSSVRIQGLRGRYTRILADGLPLYGAQGGSLGMLQIPPMDLGQVEVIKGTASALYGGSALGGVVNLISRRPGDERELLLNATSRGGGDGVLWLAGELGEASGWSLLAGGHRQAMHDVSGDGWADLAGYRRALLRPRLHLDDGAGRSLFVTAGAMVEDREGGTLTGVPGPAGGYREALDSRRADVGVVGRLLLGDDRLLSVRASAMAQRHDHAFGQAREQDRHGTAFGELSLTGVDRGHTWVLGAALQQDRYTGREVRRFDYARTTGSLFVQDELSPAAWLTLAASGRLDVQDEYGAVLSPRLSLLARPGEDWTARLSAGTGYVAPVPFTEETEAVGLSPLRALEGLSLERARNASLDLGRELGHLELNATLFASEVRSPLMVRERGGELEMFNADGPTRAWGTDLLARFHEEPFHLTATYTWTRSTEADPAGAGRREAPLTPRHAAGMVAMWEEQGSGRVGLEFYYTGRQLLEDNPYRDRSRPYLIMGLLVERRMGPARIFLNGENLLDARQTRWQPLLLPVRSAVGRWTTDAWAPLEGRTFNAGVRLEF
jgi:outer membrane receptor for ferrienterochelin and colicins